VRPATLQRAAFAGGLLVAGCGGGDADALRPVVDQIAPAIDAVEVARGGPQRYFEVNATPQFVNVFVAGADASEVEVYLYHDGELGPPTPPEAASGPTFDAAAAAFDADRVLAGLDDDLPDSDVTVFAISGGPDGMAQFSAIVESDEGGLLDVSLSPSGDVLAVDPRDGGDTAGS
jgi:hypothetical protein